MSFLDPEAALIARVQQALDSLTSKARIYSASDLASIDERQQLGTSIYVVFNGFTPAADIPRAVQVTQQWVIVVAVKNASAADNGAGIRQEAGPLILAVLKYLQGYRPGRGWKALSLVDGPGPEYSPGFAYFPMAFETAMVAVATES